jgi:Xaa-Pro aminopeptidase
MTDNTQKVADERSRYDDIDARLADARQKTWAAVEAIAKGIHPGMRESEGIKLAQQTLVDMGARKFWHKCHIRFGAGTILSFNDPYADEILRPDDIFYIDIGPIWDGIEGDAGATFVVGADAERARCRDDARVVFQAVKDHWQRQKVSGKALYEFAEEQAQRRGWVLAPSYVRGHRLSEFPHSFHSKLQVDELAFCPSPQRWVLEIHVCDPKLTFGAFYEDLL